MPDNIQLTINGVVVFQTDAAARPPAGPPAPPISTSVGSTATRQTVGPIVATNGVNRQLQSDRLNNGSSAFDTVAFAFDIPLDAVGSYAIEFTNASYATNAACRVAISRNPDDAAGAQGFPYPSRTGFAISGHMEFEVNAGVGDIVLASGRWYLVMALADLAILHALPGGYQADRLMWLRDSTPR